MQRTSSRAHRLWVRSSLLFRQNRISILFVASWLLANAILLNRISGLPWDEAIAVAACAKKLGTVWGTVYRAFTEIVVFGLVISMVVANVTRKYRPEDTCRALAEEASDHVVVIGYTNLGRRVVALVREHGRVAVVVEENRAAEGVDDLIRDEHPLVLGCGRDESDMRAAAVARASVVVIASDDVEVAAVAARNVRKVNAACELIVRCADDDVGEILARAYAARIVSTSKMVAKFIGAHAERQGTRRCVVLGDNSVGRRVTRTLGERSIATTMIASTEDERVMAAAGVREADLVVLADDDLGKNLIRVDRVRDLNPHAKIVCRVFHEDAAEVLTQRPFHCLVVSTSRYAVQTLVREGAFRKIGLETLPARPAVRGRALAVA